MPLSKASDLGTYIQKQNAAILAHENLVKQYAAQVKTNSAKGLDKASLVSQLHGEMTKSGVTVPTFKVEDYFVFDDNAKHNVQVWANAKKISDINQAKDLKKVCGASHCCFPTLIS